MSHLSSIGFQVKSQKALKDLARQAVEKGEAIAGGAGHYYRWRLEGGSELWVHVDEEGGVVGIEPHFNGPARMAVTLRERVARSPSAMDGGFEAAAEAAAGALHPFLFDVPDYARHAGLGLPARVTVQLAAFAHSLEAFPDAVAFAAAQRGAEVAFTAETLIPVSVFAPQARPAPEIPPELADFLGEMGAEPAALPLPEAVALLSGVVVETESRLNPAGSALFRHARVRTAGGEVDVVADPRIVQGEVVTGGVIYGDCWLSGRLAEGDGR